MVTKMFDDELIHTGQIRALQLTASLACLGGYCLGLGLGELGLSLLPAPWWVNVGVGVGLFMAAGYAGIRFSPPPETIIAHYEERQSIEEVDAR